MEMALFTARGGDEYLVVEGQLLPLVIGWSCEH